MLLNCGVGEDSWVSFGCKEIQPVNPNGNQSWIFIGRTDAEAEAPILWPPDEKNWLIGKDPDAEKDWGQEEKGMKEDEMVGWHHWLNGHEFEWTPGVGDGQGGLVCCDSWGCKELDWATELNWTELIVPALGQQAQWWGRRLEVKEKKSRLCHRKRRQPWEAGRPGKLGIYLKILAAIACFGKIWYIYLF